MNTNPKIQAYLDRVCAQVHARQVHADIRLELAAHIEEMSEEIVQTGMSQEEAIDQALLRMGSPEEVGRQLHRAHQPRIEWSLFALLGCLVGLGLLASYSVQRSSASPTDMQFASLFIRQFVYSAVGFGLTVVLFCVDYRRLQRYSPYLYGLVIFLIVISITGGVRINGRTALGVGPIRFSVVDLTPILLIAALAGLFTRWNWSNPHAILGALVLLAIPILLYLAAPSLPAVIIYLVAFLAVMWASGAKWWQTSTVGLLPTMCGLGLLMGSPYRMARLFAFLDKNSDPQGAGWIYLRTQEVLQSAGFWGRGFTLTNHDLPMINTDLVFPTLVHTYGWVMGAMIIIIALVFIARTSRVALATHDRYGRIMTVGLTTVFAVQFAWNILMTLGWAPMTGVGLPFISYGGSQIILHMVAMGLVLSIYRHKDVIGVQA